MKRYRIYSEFTPQAHNLEIVYSLLRRVERGELSSNELPAVAVFMAFTIESYLNSVGQRRFPKWRERDSWRDKIKALHRDSGHVPDWDSAGLSLAIVLFNIRDRLAHGKSETAESRAFETIEAATACLNDPAQPRPKPKWLVDFELELPSVKNRFQELLSYLAEIGGVERLDFLYKTLDCVTAERPGAK